MPCYRWDGSKWVMTDRPLFRRWSGSSWVDAFPKRFNGSSWEDAEKEKLPVQLFLRADSIYGLRAQIILLPLKSGLQSPTNPHTYYSKLYGVGSSPIYFPDGKPRVYTISMSFGSTESNMITLGFDFEYQNCEFWLETRDGITTEKYSTSFDSFSGQTKTKNYFVYRAFDLYI